MGYDNTLGYLDGDIGSWKNAGKAIDEVNSISAAEFETRYGKGALDILDVRRPTEYATGHVTNAENKPLDFINDWTGDLNRDKTYYVHCAGGYRSMITASILKSRGFENLVEVAGGYGAIAKTNISKTDLVAETK